MICDWSIYQCLYLCLPLDLSTNVSCNCFKTINTDLKKKLFLYKIIIFKYYINCYTLMNMLLPLCESI